MQTINVAFLSDKALDYAVAISRGYKTANKDPDLGWRFLLKEGDRLGSTLDSLPYSTSPTLGYAVLEEHRISLEWHPNLSGEGWSVKAVKVNPDGHLFIGYGDTPLKAGLRCFVSMVLGDTVSIPDALL